jgi:hypothetical protein
MGGRDVKDVPIAEKSFVFPAPENVLTPSNDDFLFANPVSGDITAIRLKNFTTPRDLRIACRFL